MKATFKTLCLAIVIAGFVTTSYAQNNAFEITFDIKGLVSTGASVTIFGDSQGISYDAVDVLMMKRYNQRGVKIEDGKFVFKGTAKEATVIRLWMSDELSVQKTIPGGGGYLPTKSEQLWFIVYPGAKFSVKGDITGKDYMSVFARDGGENDYFAELNEKQMPLLSEIGNLGLVSRQSGVTSAETEAAGRKSMELGRELAKVQMDFLEKNPNSLAALWLMSDMLLSRGRIDPDDLKPLLAKVDKGKYGTNNIYRAVSDRVTGAYLTAVGQMSPNIETDDSYAGKPFSLLNMRGKYAIVYFWGTWCGPCVQGMPDLIAFRNKHQDKLEVVAISNDRTVDIWKDGVKRLNMDVWHNIMIGRGEDKNFVTIFNVQGFPTKILLDPQGKILLRGGSEKEFYTQVEEFMAK